MIKKTTKKMRYSPGQTEQRRIDKTYELLKLGYNTKDVVAYAKNIHWGLKKRQIETYIKAAKTLMHNEQPAKKTLKQIATKENEYIESLGATLVRKQPYTIKPNGYTSMHVAINPKTGAKIGLKYYECVMPNGIIMLVPEKLAEL